MCRLRRTIFDDPDYLRALFKLAFPIALQMLLVSSLNMIDTVMIGRLGEVPIAAVALANQVFFLLLLFLFGVGSGAGVFAAQYWGTRDKAGVQRTLGISILGGSIGAVFFYCAAAFVPEQVIAIYSRDTAVITLSASYLRMVAPSYFFTAVTIVFSSVIRSTGSTKLPLFVTAISLLINTLLNLVLIFGLLGFPAMGVRGAALATAIARSIEATLLILLAYARHEPAVGTLRNYLSWNAAFIKRFWATASPVVLNEIGWSLGVTVYVLVYARMGTEVVAAFNIADTVIRLSFVVFMGTANAALILTGNQIGAGELERASVGARRILAITPLMGAAAGLALVAAAPLVPLLFEITPEARRIVTQFLLISGFVVPVKVSNLHIVVGLLRGGGDTRYSLFMDVGILWLVGVPLVAFAGLVLGLAPPLVFLCTIFEELVKYVLGLRRILSDRWVHQVTEHAQQSLPMVPQE
ncbi:MAG: MATE family efflux transporter [Spirochaeta sp.]|nr:MATE family efflux transporter [Spirochaeta sp.]